MAKKKATKKKAAKKSTARKPAKIGVLNKKIASMTALKNKLAKKFELEQRQKTIKAALKKLRTR